MKTVSNDKRSCIHQPHVSAKAVLGRTLAVMLLLYGAAASAAEIFNLSGDVAALQQAIERANAGTERVTVAVAGTFEFGPDQSLPPIVGDVEIRPFNSGAIFRPADDGGPDQLIRIEPGGRLALTRLAIQGFL